MAFSEPAGGWEWVSGEPWNYENWRTSPAEPNNNPVAGPENYLHLNYRHGWNDINLDAHGWIHGYVIEYNNPSSDAALITNSWVYYSSANTTGSIELEIAPNLTGTATVTVTVEDGGLDGNLATSADNATTNRSFDVSVLAGDWAEENDSQETAYPLGLLEGMHHFPDLTIHRGDTDWFSFSMPSTGTIDHFAEISFDAFHADLELELYDAYGSLLRETIQRSVNSSKRLSLHQLGPGDYYLRIVAPEGGTNPHYTLNLHAPILASQADWAEENDSLATALDLRTVSGREQWAPLEHRCRWRR